MAAHFGFIEETHEKIETRASFIPNLSSIQNSDSTELKPENTSKIIMFKYLSLEFTISSGCLGWATLFYCGTP